MADYLTRLGARAVSGDAPSVQPRLPSRYEGTSDDDVEIEPDAAQPEQAAAQPAAAVQPNTTVVTVQATEVEPATPAAEPLSPMPPVTTEVDDDGPQPVPVHAILNNLNVLHEVVHQLTDGEEQHEVVPVAAATPAPLPSTADAVQPGAPAREPAPVVRVTIGRIEVRAASTPAPQPAAPPTVARHPVSQPPPGERLSAYLRGEHRERPR